MKKSSGMMLLLLVIVQISCALSYPEKDGSGISSKFSGNIENHSVSTTYYAVVGTVNARECPSTTCGVNDYWYSGEIVEAVCGSGNWCKTQKGWVYAPCLGMEGVCK